MSPRVHVVDDSPRRFGLAAAIGHPRDLIGKERQQGALVVGRNGCNESVQKRLTCHVGHFHPGPLLAHATARSADNRATCNFALAKDLGNFCVVALEYLVEQERSPLLGGQAFEQDQKCDGETGGQLGL
jgi:hypothetical protein